MTTSHANSARSAALDMSADEFRELGHGLVDGDQFTVNAGTVEQDLGRFEAG